MSPVPKGGGCVSIGSIIKRYRAEHGLSLREFAERCGLNKALATHKIKQEGRIATTKGYDKKADLVVADQLGGVADIKYIRRYMHRVADRAGVHRIPPKNLRSTNISLMASLGTSLSVIQQLVGHASVSTTADHYVRVFDEDVQRAVNSLHDSLHDNNA